MIVLVSSKVASPTLSSLETDVWLFLRLLVDVLKIQCSQPYSENSTFVKIILWILHEHT